MAPPLPIKLKTPHTKTGTTGGAATFMPQKQTASMATALLLLKMTKELKT